MAVLKKPTVRALVGSFAVHALAAAATTVLASRSHSGDAPDPAAIEVDLLSPSTPASTAVEPNAAGEEAAAQPAPAHASHRAALTPAQSPRLPGEPQAPAPARSADESRAWSFGTATPPDLGDLGVGSYWRSLATDRSLAPPARTGEAAAEQTSPPTPAEILRDGLEEHDRALGLGRGALLSAARDALSGSSAPDEGSATIEIDSDSEGKVVSARVVAATAEVAAWNAVAREIVRLMSSKVVHATREGRGLRTRLRVVAERTLPSGAKYVHSTGPAVPDDACVGQADRRLGGLGRKCSTGLPAGASQSFDLADVGARPSRVVHVQLQGEVPL